MSCPTCESILLQQYMASANLHWESSKLMRLAGRNQPDLYEATLRRCQQLRDDCRKAEAALRSHRFGQRCTLKTLDSAHSLS